MRNQQMVFGVSSSYNSSMVTFNGHFDGKSIVPDEPSSLRLRSGTRLKVSVEPVDEAQSGTKGTEHFEPLNIQIDPELSESIASDPEFNIEES
jgi:hypothetical protein